jgi:hypothetical protein
MCVDVGSNVNVRSGEFIVGNFASYVRGWDGGPEQTKLYYIPLYPGKMSALRVTAENLNTATPQAITFNFSQRAWTQAGINFYPSGTRLPVRGRWRLTASVEKNWGCFELTL